MRQETEDAVTVPVGRAALSGVLSTPYGAGGLIVFAIGRGSKAPWNLFIAEKLHQAGLATFLFDLLTDEEEDSEQRGAEIHFEIPLLADRLGAVTDWLELAAPTRGLPTGYLGTSTGAAAALIAAVDRPSVRAIVSSGGRPELAGEWLPRAQAATLFIVGAADTELLRLNEEAMRSMFARQHLAIVEGAADLSDEPGALEDVARLASQWFTDHLLVAGLGSGTAAPP
jgi:putative phosphoribosyl transferase